jgi:hypothetical protein
MQPTALFSTRLTSSLSLHFASEEDLDPNDQSSVPFGNRDEGQIEALQMNPSLPIGGSETDPSHDINTFLGTPAFGPARGVEMQMVPE